MCIQFCQIILFSCLFAYIKRMGQCLLVCRMCAHNNLHANAYIFNFSSPGWVQCRSHPASLNTCRTQWLNSHLKVLGAIHLRDRALALEHNNNNLFGIQKGTVSGREMSERNKAVKRERKCHMNVESSPHWKDIVNKTTRNTIDSNGIVARPGQPLALV